MSMTAAAAKAALAALNAVSRAGKKENGEGGGGSLIYILIGVCAALFLLVGSIFYVVSAPTPFDGALGLFQDSVLGALGFHDLEGKTAFDEGAITIMTDGIEDETRKSICATALSLVGRVGYFWGGKPSAPEWDENWGKPRQVTAPGVSASGTIRPYGMDCSGFTEWAFWTALQERTLTGGVHAQWAQSVSIAKEDLVPGDLAFKNVPDNNVINHVGIYYGKINY